MRGKTFILFIFFICNLQLYTQNYFWGKNIETQLFFENLLLKKNLNNHASIRTFLLTKQLYDSIYNDIKIDTNLRLISLISNSKIKEKNYIHFSPVLNFTTKITSDFFLGAQMSYGLSLLFSKKKLKIESYYEQGTINDVNYIQNFIDSNNVIPGLAISINKYNYHQLKGKIKYKISNFFALELGKSKHFLGNGYRSLLLSQNSLPYPYLKLTTRFWKIKYINIFSQLSEFQNNKKDILRDKFASTHYLSWQANKNINLSYFESIIFQGHQGNFYRRFDLNYLNPVIFYRPVEYSLGSSDNVIMGLNLSYTIFKRIQFYGQLIIDEFLLKEIKARNGWWANKYGWQTGIKFFNLFGINNLYLLTEWNKVRPFTYSHSIYLQNYGNFNQALAHPFGANFNEYFMLLSYIKKRWLFSFKTSIAQYGIDSSQTSYGKDIYKSYKKRPSDFGNYTLQGLKTNLQYFDFRISYLINPSESWLATIGFKYRNENNTLYKNELNYIYIAIKRNIFNISDDF